MDFPLPTDRATTAVHAPGEGPGYWAGAPCARLQPDGTWVIAYRVRHGHDGTDETVVAVSEDGEHLHTVVALEETRWNAMGMERPAILAHLALRQPGRAWIAEDAARKIVGFVLGREGRMATSLGPVVADNEAVALALIAKAAASAPGPFIIDVPVAHRAVRTWLEGQGATNPRGYMRMTLGEAKGLDDPSHVFALAGPELG